MCVCVCACACECVCLSSLGVVLSMLKDALNLTDMHETSGIPFILMQFEGQNKMLKLNDSC